MSLRRSDRRYAGRPCRTNTVPSGAILVGRGTDDERHDRTAGRSSRPHLRTDAERHRRPHRIHRRRHHLSHDGLHRVRQSADPRQGRHGPGRGVRRDLHRVRGLDHGDGALRQLPDRARARHGAQRLLRLHRGARLQVHLAAGAGGGVLLGRAVLPDLDLPHPRIRHQCDSEKPQARDLRRRRPVPRHHRAGGGQDRGGASGDAGHARRPQAMAGDPVPARLCADRRAQLPQDHRRHRDRHPGRHADRHSARACAIRRHRLGAAVAGADAVRSSTSRASPSTPSSSWCSASCWSTCSTTPAR